MPAYTHLGYGIIDADQHWDGPDMPTNIFSARLPERLQSNAPSWIVRSDGTDAISFNGGSHVIGIAHKANATAAGLRKPAELSVSARLREMDLDGIHAAVLFTVEMPINQAYEGDREMVLALVSAYNDYKIEEVSQPSDNRLFTLAMLPHTGVKDAVAEMERCQATGHKGVQINQWPGGPDQSADDDYFWAAAAEMGMAVCIHAVHSFGGTAQDIARAVHGAGVAARFPNLRIGLIEQGSGWVPHFLEQSDWGWLNFRQNEAFKDWLRSKGMDPSRHSGSETIAPSDSFRQLFYTSFLYEPFAVEVRHHIGVDRMMWSTDYPHGNSCWPRSRVEFDHLFSHVPAADVKLLVHDNAKVFFGLEEVP